MKNNNTLSGRILILLNPKELKLHNDLLQACSRFKSSTEDIVIILLAVARSKLYRKLRRRSLVEYIVEELKIDSTFTFDLNRVVRTALEYPPLEKALRDRRLSVSKATRILSAIKPENVHSLIDYAATHTFAETNTFVANAEPAQNCRETWKQLSADQFKVTVVFSAEQFKQLRRAQSLEAQKQKSAKMVDALGASLALYIKRCDPMEKAERSKQRNAKKITLRSSDKNNDQRREDQSATRMNTLHAEGSSAETQQASQIPFDGAPSFNSDRQPSDADSAIILPDTSLVYPTSEIQSPNVQTTDLSGPMRSAGSNSTSVNAFRDVHAPQTMSYPGRIRLTAAEIHAVHQITKGRCCFRDRNNKRCENDRWLEIHHIIPVSQGGTNAIENLIHLCGPHHDVVHQIVLPLDDQAVYWTLAP